MSVVEPERHKGRLEVHVKAQALAAYTALIVKNPKVFDPEVDEDLIKRIKSYSMDIYEKAWPQGASIIGWRRRSSGAS